MPCLFFVKCLTAEIKNERDANLQSAEEALLACIQRRLSSGDLAARMYHLFLATEWILKALLTLCPMVCA